MLSKYGWTLDYTLWGISFQNITMLLSDSISVFFEKDGDDDVTMDADDIDNIDMILKNFN
ncbi:MAG: hypothetical protein PHH23_01740 [Paludibacteraceae bacterium]|nr:hypothetical protein [Paludibacteraceae bacterium]